MQSRREEKQRELESDTQSQLHNPSYLPKPPTMLYEDLRGCHEDLERLEQAISDRMLEEPKHIRDRLARDHEMAQLLERIKTQSQRGLQIYKDSTLR